MSLFSKKFISDLSIEFKLRLFICFCILIHIMITAFAIYAQITYLVVFNLCSVLIYFLCTKLVKKHQPLIFYIGFSEILLHTFLTVILIGNEFGFSMYFVAIIPLSFHLLNAIKSKKYILKAAILSSISFLLFASCYIFSNSHEAIYSSATLDKLKPYVYLTNMLITFATLLVFTMLFLLEINVAYKRLYDSNAELETLANTDPLTGLYNRRTMTIHVQNMYQDYHANKNPFSLIVCDIDDFKLVNDTYGHDQGDKVLVTISTILSKLTRGLDFVCRWGGEEFIIFLRYIDREEARDIAENIRQEIAQTEMKVGDKTIHVTMTFGVSSVTETDDYKELFDLADSRMYEGKKSGKNKVV